MVLQILIQNIMVGVKMSNPTIIDLFAGCGGISEGFISAGFDCISAVEIDKEIANTLQKNHPKTKVFNNDISLIDSKELKKNHKNIDVVVGGPPCQGFSMAGKRIRKSGLFIDDPRNNLFKEFYRVVSDIKPKVFVMENVPGILSINEGLTKDQILELFKKIGYKAHVNVLLASDYGVPQLRKRAFFIGTNLDVDPKDLFPNKTHGYNLNKYISVEDAIFDLPFISHDQGSFVSKYSKNPLTEYQAQRRKSDKLYNHISTNHDLKVIEILKLIKEGQGLKDLNKKYHTKSVHSGAYGRINRHKPAYTITTRFDTPPVGRVTHPCLNRSLTPREAARLQSFDDDFIFYGTKTSIGVQIGNAVPPLLANAIAKKIIDYI